MGVLRWRHVSSSLDACKDDVKYRGSIISHYEMMETRAEMSGSQSIGRAIGLLRILTRQPHGGMALAKLAEAAGLHPTTAHRQLAALLREGLVEQDGARRYHPGVELWLMGQVAARRFDVADLARETMKRIADETEDTVYLFVRSRHQAVCVARVEGSFPIRALTLVPGDRRPLGVNAGALALLSFQSAEVRDDVLAHLAPELRPLRGYSVDTVRRQVAETRTRGFSIVTGTIVPGMSAVAVPVLDRDGQALAALSVAAIEQRMSPKRCAQIAKFMQVEARALARRLSERGGADGRKKAQGGKQVA
jgi:DNA-binding IclR family transcriptional regulator